MTVLNHYVLASEIKVSVIGCSILQCKNRRFLVTSVLSTALFSGICVNILWALIEHGYQSVYKPWQQRSRKRRLIRNLGAKAFVMTPDEFD